jgi:acyl carrier protein
LSSAASDRVDEVDGPGARVAVVASAASSPPGGPFDRAGILVLLDRLIREVVGEDYDLGIDLEPDVSFSDDLELESLEFVQIGEKLQEIYGERVDFVAWFSDLDVDEIIDLTVGDLVEFIEGCR